MFTITKEFHFSASHQLKKLPTNHPCARLHGHNYILIVELQSEKLNNYNFVRDYRDLTSIKNYIDGTLDHRHLNDVFQEDAVTAEILAYTLYNLFKKDYPELKSITIRETEKTSAQYRP